MTGALYKARHLRDQREVALKVVDSRLTTGDSAAFIARFQGDITIAASIHHPALMRIHRCAVNDGVLYYSMELVPARPWPN